jgi:curved DNA-binding protein
LVPSRLIQQTGSLPFSNFIKSTALAAMSDDLYSVLGVPRGAPQADIKKAYRKLSRENHPDAKPNDEAASLKFKQVQAAYEVLSDPEKREKYDRYGNAAFQRGGAGPGSGPIDLSDIFGQGFDFADLFGGGGRRAGGFGGGGFGGGGFGGGRPAPRKGQDVETSIEVPFTTAAEGGEYSLSLNIGGRHETLTVRIPPGVNNGSVIRLAGQGHPGSSGGPAGDLRVTLKVSLHPWFRRDGANLLVDVPVTIFEATLGGKVDVPTLSEGLVTVSVPAGSASGTKLRLRGKGVTDAKTKATGDLFAVLKIVAPKELDETSRELLEQLRNLNPQDPRESLWT